MFDKNIAAMRQANPALASALAQTPVPQDQMAMIRAADGTALLAVRQPDGSPLPLGDRNAPVKEAETWAAGLGRDCLTCGHVLALGFGAGHFARAVFQASDAETYIWIYEPSLPLLKAGLHIADVSFMILSNRVKFAAGIDEKALAKTLFDGVEANRTRAQGIQLIIPPVHAAIYGGLVQRLGNTLQEAIEFDKLKFKTEEAQGKEILENAAANLPMVLRGAPLLRMQSAFPGIPAWIIAPGPSLEESIEAIRSCKDNALIIAVDTANRILHKHGLAADIVVSIDYTDLNVRHFETIENDPAVLAAFVGVDPAIPKKYIGRSLFYTHDCNRFVQSLSALGPLGELESPGSTAHAAYSLARMMGCSPMVLIGNDLAFPRGRWYADGAMQNDLHQPEREAEPLFEVPANDGSTVKTNALYKIYAESFGELIRDSAGVVINASLQGAKIQNTLCLPLNDVIKKHCPARVDKSPLERAVKHTLAWQAPAARREIESLQALCDEFQSRMDHLKQDAENLSLIPRKFHAGMKNNMETLQGIIQSYPKAVKLLIPLCARATVSLFGQMGNVGILGGDTAEQNKIAKQKFVQFSDDFIAAAIVTRERLQTIKL